MFAAYKIRLTDDEIKALAWASRRGYFPAETYAALASRPANDGVYTLAEHECWPLMDLYEEDPDAHLACIGEPLRSKILNMSEDFV